MKEKVRALLDAYGLTVNGEPLSANELSEFADDIEKIVRDWLESLQG